MKKGFLYFIVFIIVVSWLLQLYKNYSLSDDDTIQVIKEKRTMVLNDFLKAYKKWLFSKVVLTDGVDLVGYEYLWTGKKTTLMTLNKSFTEQYVNTYSTKKPLDTSLNELGIDLTGKVLLDIEYQERWILQTLFEEVGPILLFFVVFLLFFKFMMPKWWSWFPFNVKAGKLDNKAKNKTKFSDVAGMEEVKAELSEIVDYLKNPAKYHKVWARHPKWVLLFGEPWSGKTLLARAVAGESNVPFFSVSGSEFMEMLVGMGAAKVRELFGKAKAVGKAIIFIDEIDAIGRRRWAGYSWGHQEQEQTLNQILTEMDGFDTNTNIIVIAATNRPDVLDPALLRAGRFDRKVMVSRPTYEERISIFTYYLKTKKIDENVNIESLAKRTSGLVGADIENIVNEASLRIAKDGRVSLGKADFEYALEKVLMGPEKKVKSMNEQEKKIVTFHELWHAVTAYLLPQADPVEKISIVRRWYALGVTWMTPEEDKNLYSKAKFLDQIVSLLWWRAAEEVFFGEDEITTGASNDFEKATGIITDMITKYGMDEDIGTISYADSEKNEYNLTKPYSERTAEMIDKKIKTYMSDCYDKAKKIIKTNKSVLESLSELLLEKEYLTKEEFESMMQTLLKKND